MRTKKVNRYYCDYCKKSGCAAGHMKRHEERCTKNPNRMCGVCAMRELPQPSMAELLDTLPEPVTTDDEYGFCATGVPGLEEAMKVLYDKTEGCPACTMAALRQKGIPIPMTKFDFKSEMAQVWSEFNEAHRESVVW